MATTRDVMEASIDEIASQPERFLDIPVEVRGHLQNAGASYFHDLSPVLRDGDGHLIPVLPWLPLEAPASARPGSSPPRTAVMSDFLGMDVVLEGTWQKHEGGFALHVDHGEIVRPSIQPLSLTQLVTMGGIGGAGLYGRGVLGGELACRQKRAVLVTAAKGTQSEVSFATDLPERSVRPFDGKHVWLAGLIRKNTPWAGTVAHARLACCPEAQRMPGDHLAIEGHAEERRVSGAGGEAPPPGTWIVLSAPIRVGRVDVGEVHVHKAGGLRPGPGVRLHGRLMARHYGGVDTPQQIYFALSGVSDLAAGEPIFDGMQFLGAQTLAHLRVSVLERREMFDAPNVILVIDPAERRAFTGTAGGRVPAGENPFHGFTGSAPIEEPTAADRAAVRFDERGIPRSGATGAPLTEIAREFPAPDTRTALAWVMYFDVGTYAVYTFSGGREEGATKRLASVMHVPHADA